MLRVSIDMLPAPFINENFDFYGRTLIGAKELRPRWKRCVAAVDHDLGEARVRNTSNLLCRRQQRTHDANGKRS